MDAPLPHLRALERSYAVEWELVEDGPDRPDREDAVVTLQRVWP